MQDAMSQARDLRAKLLADPHRPGYHIVSPEGVHAPFDPNGALFWRGRYHLMYIVQTEKGHCWAHVSSADLVHWRHHPLALEPGGVDEGIFSGGAFVDEHGVPTISYWGLGEKAGICLATSTDDHLERWTKSPDNPVVHQSELGLTTDAQGRPYGAADPSAIWRQDGRYYMLTGNLLVLRKYGLEQGQVEHQGDTAYLLRSDDLVHWQYLHPFYASDRGQTGHDEDNMCPDFFPLGERHMLLFISHNRGCQYYIGQYSDEHFVRESHGRMSWVDRAFFAPESLLDDRGRRIMWAWIMDGRDNDARKASGWSGTLSLPRVLSLADDHTLRMRPPEELAVLRGQAFSLGALHLEPNKGQEAPSGCGNSMEIDVTMANIDAARFGLSVCCSPDHREETLIYYDVASARLCVDTRRSSLTTGPKSVEEAPLALAAGEALSLRVFVDKSVVEVFANDQLAIMRRVYPTLPESVGIALWSRGGHADVIEYRGWDMAPSNPY